MNKWKKWPSFFLLLMLMLFGVPSKLISEAVAATTGGNVGNQIFSGSVPEYYDAGEPLIIRGVFSDDDWIRVFFNDDGRARYVQQREDHLGTYLEVFLPRGSRRLKTGLYDVIISNGNDRIIHGAFSVVKEGANVPADLTRDKAEVREGKVIETIKQSEDTLKLVRRYSDRQYIDLDLDDLMGEDVLIRKIKIDGRRGDTIRKLETRSKWADITLYNLTLNSGYSRDEIEVILGRPEPVAAQALQQKLSGKKIKSDFINVAGTNFKVSNMVIELPYRESDGRNLKVLRYDEDSRSWREEPFAISSVNSTVRAFTNKLGVFVVVE